MVPLLEIVANISLLCPQSQCKDCLVYTAVTGVWFREPFAGIVPFLGVEVPDTGKGEKANLWWRESCAARGGPGGTPAAAEEPGLCLRGDVIMRWRSQCGMLHIFLHFVDILAVSVNCHLFKHMEKLLGFPHPSQTCL